MLFVACSSFQPSGNPPGALREASGRAPGRLRVAPGGLREASGRPPGGLREASGRPSGGLREASGRPPGYHSATPPKLPFGTIKKPNSDPFVSSPTGSQYSPFRVYFEAHPMASSIHLFPPRHPWPSQTRSHVPWGEDQTEGYLPHSHNDYLSTLVSGLAGLAKRLQFSNARGQWRCNPPPRLSRTACPRLGRIVSLLDSLSLDNIRHPPRRPTSL